MVIRNEDSVLSYLRSSISQTKTRRMYAYLQSVSGLIKDNDDEAAKNILEKAKATFESQRDMPSDLVRRYIDVLSHFDMDEARTTFMEAGLRGNADDATALDWAKHLISDDSQDEARDILGTIGRGPFEAERHHCLAVSWMETGDLVKARDALLESIRWDPRREAPYQLLEQLEPQSNWGLLQQIEAFRYDDNTGQDPFSDDLDGKGPMVRLAKALHMWRSQSPDAAIGYWKGIRSRYGSDMLVQKVGARMFMHSGRNDAALERYDEAMRSDPGNIGLRQEYGDALIYMGFPHRSQEVFDRILEDAPMFRGAMISRIRAFSDAGDEDGCSKAAEEFSLSPHWVQPYQNEVVQLLLSCGAHLEASRLLDLMLSESPQDIGVVRLIRTNHAMAGDSDDALRAADKAIKMSGGEFEDYLAKARVQLDMGNVKGCKRTLSNIVRLEPSNLAALSLLREASKAEGDDVAVLEMCEQILRINPDDTQALKDKASSLDRTGSSEEAMQIYGRVLKLDDGAPVFLEEIMGFLLENGRVEEGASLSDDFIDLHEGNGPLWVLRGNSLYGTGRFDEAAESYSKAIESEGHDPRYWIWRGLSLEMGGQLQDASECYDRAIVGNVSESEGWVGKAMVLEKMEDPRGALRNLDQALHVDPGNRSILINKARILVKLSRYDEAIYHLDMAIRLDGNDINVLRMKKEVLRHTQDHEGVVAVCDDILRIEKGDVGALIDKGKALQNLSRHGDALKMFSQVLKDNQDDRTGLLLRKDSLVAMGRNREAISVLEKTTEDDPKDLELLFQLTDLFLDEGDVVKAVAVLDKVLSIDPLNHAANIKKAKALLQQGDVRSSVDIMKHVLSRKEDDEESIELMSEGLLQMGDAEGSLMVSQGGLANHPRSTGLAILRSRSLIGLGRTEEALQSIEDALESAPRERLLWRYKGKCLLAMGNHRSALHSLDRAIGFGDEDALSYYHRAEALLAMGNRSEAVRSLRRSIDIDGNNVESWSLLGKVQTDDGDLKGARRSLDRALSLSPDHPATILRQARLLRSTDDPRRALESYDHLQRIDGAGASVLVEKGELLLGIGDRKGAAEAFSAASAKDPEYPGLSKRLEDLEGGLRDEEASTLSHTVLERSYRDGRSLDMKYIESLVPEPLRDHVAEITMGAASFKRPIVWSDEFESLEEASRSVILSSGHKDVQSIISMDLPSVYMNMHDKDINKAKEVRDHIRRSLSEDLETGGVMSARVQTVRESISKSESHAGIAEVMRKHGLGPYGARLALGARQSQ